MEAVHWSLTLESSRTNVRKDVYFETHLYIHIILPAQVIEQLDLSGARTYLSYLFTKFMLYRPQASRLSERRSIVGDPGVCLCDPSDDGFKASRSL